VSFSLQLSFVHQDRVVAPAPEAAAKPTQKRAAKKRQ